MKKYSNFYSLLFAFILVLSSCKDEEIVSNPDALSPNITSKLINDNVGGTDVVIVGNPASDFIVSFERQLSSGDIPDLEVVNGRLPIIMKDEIGNLYDVFGRIVEGTDTGAELTPVLSYQSYWFAIAAFFPGVEIHAKGGEAVELNLNVEPEWSIPTNNIFVGTGFDAIPSIDEPKLVLINNDGPNIDQSMIPARDDLVVGIKIGDEAFAYPHSILNWHEMLNQEVGDYSITLSFCPLTGTAIAWESNETTFGVSGLLYNSNLIAYDRETESLWSQMLAQSVHGELKDEKVASISLIETSWGTWRTMYPDTKLLSQETGFTRDYASTPYVGYIENDDLIYYPVDYEDDRLPKKERVHAIVINKQAKVYTFDSFE